MVVIYDVLFMVQHYALYPEKKKKDEKEVSGIDYSM
jgi:hypothetical protein